MNEKQTHLDWGFGLKWMLSCALGTAVFGMAAYGSMWWAGEAVTEVSNESLGVMVAGILFGAFFALGGTLGPASYYAARAFQRDVGLATVWLLRPL